MNEITVITLYYKYNQMRRNDGDTQKHERSRWKKRLLFR